MSIGKYSPTVSAAYARDQKWHDKLCGPLEWYDDEGYDSYGYHKDTDKDRAGYTENEYLGGGEWIDDEYRHPLYENVMDEWTYDGVRPVRRK